MSKVVITGNASGTGDFTIAAPNSNTNRTLTLPDITGTVLTDSAGVLNIGAGQVYKDASGNVGIGTSSPAHKIDVSGNGRVTGDFYVGASTNIIYESGSNLNVRAANSLLFNTSGANERMRIDSSGNVLVGTTTAPTSGGIGAGFQPGVSVAGNTTLTFRANTTGIYEPMFFYNPNGLVGFIRTSASATSYATSSDYRLKEDWQPMSGSVDRVKALNPVNFAWKVDGSRVDGFLAHEAQAVVPEAITGKKDAVTAYGNITDTEGTVVQESVVEPETLEEGQMWTKVEDKPDYQGIDQSKLVPLLTAALQEAITKIEALEARVTALENA